MLKKYLQVFSLFAFCLVGQSAAQAASLKVFAFNVLAPPWANPSIYPASAAPYLETSLRRQAIINVLKSAKSSTDVFCLQETTPIEFGFFASELKEFVGMQANHDPDYWSQYITEVPPWEPNGNAIFVKKSVFSNIQLSDQALSTSGNHGAYATATHKDTNKKIRILSVHFDTDTGGNRNREMEAAIQLLSVPLNSVDMIVGDFNSSPDQGNYYINLKVAGFVDVLGTIGNTELTHPYAAQYINSTNFGVIDHLLVRGATPSAGDVIDNNLFNLYPIVPGHTYEDARITENMRLVGSDHFPFWGSVTSNP